MNKDPFIINKITDRPECFEQYDENNELCTDHCGFNHDCQSEKQVTEEFRDLKRVDTRDNPVCFGDHFSPNSPTCKIKCKVDSQCETLCQASINRSLERPLASIPNIMSAQEQRGIRSDSLKVVQPYQQQSPTSSSYIFNWADQAKSIPSYYTHKYNTQSTNDFFKPGVNITNEQAEKYYGTPLHPRPLIPGQFINEPWYERFGKNVTLSVGDAFVRIICEQISNAIRNIVWAPKK